MVHISFFSRKFSRGCGNASLRWRCVALLLVLVFVLGACDETHQEAGLRRAGASGAPDASFSGSYLAGQHAAVIRDFGAAADFMAAALAYEPGNQSLLRRTFYLMAGEGRFGEADAIAGRVLENTPDDPIAGLYLMARAFQAGQYADALVYLERMPQRGLNAYLHPLFSAWTHFAMGDAEKAIVAMDRQAQVEGFEPIYNYHLALLYDLEGRADSAERNYVSALGDHPLSLRTIETLGNFYERQDRKEEAQTLYDRYISDDSISLVLSLGQERLDRGDVPGRVVKSPGDGLAEVFYNLSLLLHRQSVFYQQTGYGFALVFARLAMDLREDFDDARVLAAEIYETQERHRAAIAMYERVSPKTAWGWFGRIRIARNYDLLEAEDQAVRLLRKMAKERPDRIDVLVELGTLLRVHERYREAIKVYSEAIRRTKKIKARHWTLFYARGIALEQAGTWKEAEADLLRALELQPDQPYVLNYLGYSWLEKGQKLAQAQRLIERAVALRPKDGFIVDSLGWALYHIGKYDEALPHLELAVQLRPHDPVINDHLGDAYWQVGRRYEAKFQWRRTLAFDADAKLGANIESKLKRGLPIAVKKATEKQ
ncbi:MAG: hypothetical protein COA65_05015 [Rhodospirillaceae bacterium]|nr:MAG: hypothetical protein COA65_05015 [Rhodospirillaceae bacterium]